MPKSVSERVQRRRDVLRKSGLRPAQIWAFDTRSPAFAAECRRQSRVIAEAERDNPSDLAFLDAALDDLAGDSDWR